MNGARRFLRRVSPTVAALLATLATAGAATVSGSAREVGTNIQHPNGNIYDQVLLEGVSATVEADVGQVTRISFIDLNDDIVQVEFSGKGSLTVSLANASGPAVAAKYHQPDVRYMRGHATITIAGSDTTSNVGVFSVGECTAVNRSLFPDGMTYDAVADIAAIRIVADPNNPSGSTFGGIRTGNAQYFASAGTTGIIATNVHVQDVVIIHDLAAFDDATPTLTFGTASQFATLTIAGGDLFQPNGRAIQRSGFFSINTVAGTKSNCGEQAVQPNRGEFDPPIFPPSNP